MIEAVPHKSVRKTRDGGDKYKTAYAPIKDLRPKTKFENMYRRNKFEKLLSSYVRIVSQTP